MHNRKILVFSYTWVEAGNRLQPKAGFMQNNEQIINEWVESYSDSLYQWAVSKTSDEELSKDLLQDTFIAAFQNMPAFEGRSNPKTWMLSILKNKVADHYRKQFRMPVERIHNAEDTFFDDDGMWKKDKMPQQWDFDLNLLDDRAFVGILNACLSKLPEQWRMAIQMKYLSEKGGGEICQELNISSSNYWQLIHRSKLNLRQCLELNWFK